MTNPVDFASDVVDKFLMRAPAGTSPMWASVVFSDMPPIFPAAVHAQQYRASARLEGVCQRRSAVRTRRPFRTTEPLDECCQFFAPAGPFHHCHPFGICRFLNGMRLLRPKRSCRTG